ncbi:hypothetical protein HAX54_030381 [Datura stramonium]|uniref:Uncharacterized protein n=1 Tax=Datura stramonium TaxID=4076 RepID=A0ABS8V9V3_DATST|nr:hypothetical protein [Datura stramonium]
MAKVIVEVDLTKPKLNSIWVGVEDESCPLKERWKGKLWDTKEDEKRIRDNNKGKKNEKNKTTGKVIQSKQQEVAGSGENNKEGAEISQNKSQTSYDKGNNKGREIDKQGRSGLKDRLNKIKKKKNKKNTMNEQKIVEETGLDRKEECSDTILEETGENLHENNESSILPSNIKNMSPINLVVDLNDNILTSFSPQDMVNNTDKEEVEK